tara:strand:+ start:222 stop:395 length:174 start_codon:yes stop_codon:yes gene_type:complete
MARKKRVSTINNPKRARGVSKAERRKRRLANAKASAKATGQTTEYWLKQYEKWGGKI